MADPSDEDSLERAGIDRARAVVVASGDDGADALAILTVRQLNPELRIVAAAENRENVSKLRRAGTDDVLSPASIGGHLLVRSAIEQTSSEALTARFLGDGTSETDET